MGVQFVLGKASMDHEAVMHHQLLTWMQEDPDAQFFYLVPEHIKFESEVNVLDYLRKKKQAQFFASANVQVLSFTRFAWFFLRNSSVLNRQNLSQTGLAMLVTHLLNKIQKQDLTIFSSEQSQAGFAVKLADQLVEFRLSGFEPEDLLEMQKAAMDQHQSNLADKLGDLAVIYQEFLNAKVNGQLLLDQFLDPAKLMDLLFEELQRLDLSHQYFLISGFDQFNAREIKILKHLMQNAHDVMISLPLDDLASKKLPRPNELFYRPAKLYQQLRHLVPAKNIKIRWALTPRVNSSLQKLEDDWIANHRIGVQPNVELSKDEKQQISITQTVDRISEVKWVAGKIRRMVVESQQTDHPYEYRDFLVLTPDTSKYQNLIEPVFEQFQIPLFTDLTQTMASHPLVEFILALFDVQQHGFNYQSIMRFLKTELFIPKQIIKGRTLELMRKREQQWLQDHPNSKPMIPTDTEEVELRRAATYRNTLDVVENYLLAHGIQTKAAWQKEWIVQELPRNEKETTEELLERERQLTINRNANLLREQVLELFESYQQALKSVKTGRNFAVVLYQTLEKAEIAETLRQWQQGAQQILSEKHQATDATLHGNAVDPTRPEQVWNVFCQLMDEYVLALGDEPFDRELFINIFQSGFETASYKRVPSTLDQVIFSQSGNAQMQNRKIAFMIGVTDDVMPAKVEDQKLLSEDDRNVLNDIWDSPADDEKFLPETCEMRMAEEPFTNYIAFMSPSEQLHFSYPINDSDGAELKLSGYVEKIKDDLNIPVNKLGLIAPNYGPEIIQYIGTPMTTINELLRLSRDLQRQKEQLPPEWSTIYNYVKQQNPQRVLRIFNSLNYSNDVLPGTPADENGHKKLDEALVKELYGNEIFGSISRLETYFKNPYEYFLKYGLALKPRTIFEPTSANVGDFFHDVMAALIDHLQQDGATLSTLKSDDFDQLLGQVLGEISALDEFDVFKQTARNRYLQRRLVQSTRKVSQAIYRQHRKRKVFSLKTEATFGFGNDAVLAGKRFKAVDVQRTPTPQMNLQGRLDRIDVIEDLKHHLYYNVADYKSGSINAKLDKFLVKSFSGISLQLLTYLAVLRDNQPQLLQMLRQNEAIQSQIADADQHEISLGSAIYFHLGTPQEKQTNYQKVMSAKQAISHADSKFVYDGIFRSGKEAPEDYVKALGTIYDHQDVELNLDNYKLGLLKSGKLSKASQKKMYDLDHFNALLDLDLYKISQATNDIFSGVIDLAPYKLANATGLDFSDYLPIMTFDPMIGNQYRDLNDLTHISADELWQQIEAESELWQSIKKQVEED